MHEASIALTKRTPPPVSEIGEVLELLEVAWERGRAAFSTAPLSAAQTRVLYVVERQPGINLSGLGRSLSAAAPSVSRLCDRLQAAGFLRRATAAQDRREVELELTAAGAAHLQIVRHRRAEAIRQAMERMEPEAREALVTGLKALNDAVGEPADPPPAPGAPGEKPHVAPGGRRHPGETRKDPCVSSTVSPFPERIALSGEGLVLRDWTEADLAAMPELFDHPDIAYWTPIVSPFDDSAARTRLDRARRLRAEGSAVLLAVTVDGGAPLGEVMLRRAPEGTEIGYAIGPAHRGQALAARAVRVMAAYAFEELGAAQVILELEAENAASVAVAVKAGFRLLDVPLITGEEKGRPFALQTWGLDRA